ncbi:MAG: helix-turn-helix domain-containing protein [Burkholderiales bacterium]|nr:helix-turn-helix domain-containing protein [Burkholderiales bacterium]
MIRYTHDKVREQLLSNIENMQEYENLADEFALVREMIKARLKSGKTQEELAKTLHTTKSAISRLENSGGKNKHSPTLSTLRKYADALGYTVKVRFVQKGH